MPETVSEGNESTRLRKDAPHLASCPDTLPGPGQRSSASVSNTEIRLEVDVGTPDVRNILNIRRDIDTRHPLEDGSQTIVNPYWPVAIVLVILWTLGLIGGVGGSLINILAVTAPIVGVYSLYAGRNAITGK